jgi:hypothetical protein
VRSLRIVPDGAEEYELTLRGRLARGENLDARPPDAKERARMRRTDGRLAVATAEAFQFEPGTYDLCVWARINTWKKPVALWNAQVSLPGPDSKEHLHDECHRESEQAVPKGHEDDDSLPA